MRTRSNPFRLTAVIAVAGLLFGQVLPRPALAQSAPPPLPPAAGQQPGDPPARVGRLAQVSGTVSFHRQDETDWSPAMLNYPVAAGDAFWTQPNAQAGIEVSASRIVMAPATELDVAAMTDTALQASLPQGEAYLRLEPGAPDESYAVQTPRGLAILSVPGRYLIAAGDTQSPTLITVIQGAAHVSGPGTELDVASGQTASISGTDTFQGAVGPAQPDAFLSAMLSREQPPQQQATALPASVAAMPGGEDLSAYGNWADVPDYGDVWYPEVAPGWMPYQEGNWAYVEPWGWTWVDSEPWGFAPFHYGRWAYIGSRWGWIPGPVFGHPVYAPALVAFIGVGAAVGVGIGAALGAGRIGWVPLGPREPFHPWYHASDRYFQAINRAHVANVGQINRNVTMNNFVNRRAATVVSTPVMTGSRPVRGQVQRLDPAQLSQARPFVGAQPLRPAATTAGVTPAVARHLNLPRNSIAPPAAPGPAVHAVQPVHAGLPPLHGAGAAAVPAASGSHPFGATPALRNPRPANAGPPPIQNQPAIAAPGAVLHPRPLTTPTAPPSPAVGHGNVANPAFVTHPPSVEMHAAPPVSQAPVVHTAPSSAPEVHAPSPPVMHAVPAPQIQAPAPQPAPQFHVPPPAPAPQFHAPAPQPAPQFHAPPPAPAPQFHAPAPQPAPQFHAPPPAPAPQFHAPAPQPAPQFHAPPPAPAPQFHAPQPQPTPQFHAPPPPPPQHSAPAPSGQHKRPGEP